VASWVVVALLGRVAHAQLAPLLVDSGGSPTTPTGGTPTATATGSTGGTGGFGYDTGGVYCVDCKTAAELAGDPGGSPCSGCSTATPPWIVLPLGLLAFRRRK
jgi:hypothetical protein